MALTKQITYDTVTSIGTQIDYNHRTGTTDSEGNSIDQYYPARVVVYMTGSSSDGDTNPVIQETLLGSPKSTPYTPQEIYTLVQSTQGLPALAPALKQAYEDAVNVGVRKL